ncbi:MAG: hypothetical protein PHI35_00170 [Victivallaceae bacterium]|nr:hypothetical protein [Victivallaceae bacterium]
MNKIWVIAIIGVVTMVLLMVASFMPVNAAGDTQVYAPARYAMLVGEINVGMLQNNTMPNGNEQKILFKLDTATGQVWALQLSVIAGNDPQVSTAAWYPVTSVTAAQQVQNTYQQQAPQF